MAKQYGGSFDQREQIRDAIDIVDLVGRYVPLRRQGANFVGRCPWHDDSRPSLQVNATRQTFKCWVCNIGGDVFSFIMKIENVDFKEGLKLLADMAGIELIQRAPKRISGPSRYPRIQAPIESSDEFDPNAALAEAAYADSGSYGYDGEAAPTQSVSTQNYAPELPEITKADLYRALDWLAGKYRDAYLHSSEAEEARKYVRERGISDEASERYQIGYAPLGFDSALQWIRFSRKRARILEEAGALAYREDYDDRGRAKPRPRYEQTPLLSDAERRRYYDRFRGRLIFPIRDVQDRVVAFGGRLLPNTTLKSSAKYVNSPETPIFTKSKMLYGLDRARNAIMRSKTVLVTEGYTDCIVTAQYGFENVVAVLGTALGSEHVRILKRFADKMILLLDGDGAGQKRAKEVLRFFVEQGVDMSVLTLPDDNDPCEFLLEKGPEAFANIIETKPVDALDHAFNTTTSGINLETDVVESAKALDSLLDVVALFDKGYRASNDPARLRALKAIQRFAIRFRVSEHEIRRQLSEKRAKGRLHDRRAEEREERYERRRRDREDAPENRVEYDSEEQRVVAFRKNWTYPIESSEDESDAEMRERFCPFERSVWTERAFLPDALEIAYLEFLIAAPELFPRLVAKISNELLRSPIAKQIDLVARDYLEQGLEPTFERLILRYEDDSMKSFLIELDSNARAKEYERRLADPNEQEIVLQDIFSAFDRRRLIREEPKRIGELREAESPQDRIRALLDFQRMMQERKVKSEDDSVFNEEREFSPEEQQ